MNKNYRRTIVALIVLGFLVVSATYLRHVNIAVLNPKGPIAAQEKKLIVIALLLSLIVVIPVFTVTALFAWRYRESNTKAKYSPELDGNKIAETIWWVIPTALISVLAVIAWNSSHSLDPYKPLSSTRPPLTIQVVSLDWKWLFIYPQQNIASVNFIQIPMNTPINFELTSDTVMNSFWLPQLSGQMYVMPGMSTQLHLLASQSGDFIGSSANISGQGFSGMTFTAASNSQVTFNTWVDAIKNQQDMLSLDQYNKLSEPSENNKPAYYSAVQPGLYNTIIGKYMSPGGQMSSMEGMSE